MEARVSLEVTHPVRRGRQYSTAQRGAAGVSEPCRGAWLWGGRQSAVRGERSAQGVVLSVETGVWRIGCDQVHTTPSIGPASRPTPRCRAMRKGAKHPQTVVQPRHAARFHTSRAADSVRSRGVLQLSDTCGLWDGPPSIAPVVAGVGMAGTGRTDNTRRGASRVLHPPAASAALQRQLGGSPNSGARTPLLCSPPCGWTAWS